MSRDDGARGGEHLTHRLQSAVFQSVRFRTLHIVDIENLVGGEPAHGVVQAALSAYESHVGVDRNDMVIVGIAAPHHRILTDLHRQPTGPNGRTFSFDFIKVLGHAEKDGADEALLTALDLLERRTPPLTDDFGQVSFASGDYYFVEPAARLRNEGLWILNVIGLGGQSEQWTADIDADYFSVKEAIEEYLRRRHKRKKRPKPRPTD